MPAWPDPGRRFGGTGSKIVKSMCCKKNKIKNVMWGLRVGGNYLVPPESASESRRDPSCIEVGREGEKQLRWRAGAQ